MGAIDFDVLGDAAKEGKFQVVMLPHDFRRGKEYHPLCFGWSSWRNDSMLGDE